MSNQAYPDVVSALAWWLIPIGATILAILWATLRARPAKPTEGQDGMAGLRRFQDAMERPLPVEHRDPDRDTDRNPRPGRE
jgi:hypothetical protein